MAQWVSQQATYADFWWTVICILLLVLPVSLFFFMLSGKTQRRRAFKYSLLRFYLQTFNVNTLHHWFIFNPASARDIAEVAAIEDEGDVQTVYSKKLV